MQLIASSDEAGCRVVLLEDVHWLDSPSWAVLEQAALRRRGLLLVLLTRPLVDWPIPPRATALLEAEGTVRLRLQALADSALRSVVEERLGVAKVPDSLVHSSPSVPKASRCSSARYRGRSSTRASSASSRDASCATTRRWQPSRCPIQGAVISRIERLSPRQQMTLKKASAVGRSFTLEALASADAGDVSRADLRDDIEAITQRDLPFRIDRSARRRG